MKFLIGLFVVFFAFAISAFGAEVDPEQMFKNAPFNAPTQLQRDWLLQNIVSDGSGIVSGDMVAASLQTIPSGSVSELVSLYVDTRRWATTQALLTTAKDAEKPRLEEAAEKFRVAGFSRVRQLRAREDSKIIGDLIADTIQRWQDKNFPPDDGHGNNVPKPANQQAGQQVVQQQQVFIPVPVIVVQNGRDVRGPNLQGRDLRGPNLQRGNLQQGNLQGPPLNRPGGLFDNRPQVPIVGNNPWPIPSNNPNYQAHRHSR